MNHPGRAKRCTSAAADAKTPHHVEETNLRPMESLHSSQAITKEVLKVRERTKEVQVLWKRSDCEKPEGAVVVERGSLAFDGTAVTSESLFSIITKDQRKAMT